MLTVSQDATADASDALPSVPAAGLTAGELARAVPCEIHQLRYLLDRRQITPVSRAGRVNLFDGATVERVRGILAGRRSAEVTSVAKGGGA